MEPNEARSRQWRWTLLTVVGIAVSLIVAGVSLRLATTQTVVPEFSPRVVSADRAVQFDATPTPSATTSPSDDDDDGDTETDDDDD